MPNKTAERLLLRPGDQAELERLTRSSTAPAAAAQRAQDRSASGGGGANYVIAERVGVTRPTVNLWRTRYAAGGLAGLVGQKRPGRLRQVDRAAIVAARLTPPPKTLGVPHWPSRLLDTPLAGAPRYS